MANSADPDQLASSDFSQLIWIYTVCKGRVYPGSAGQGLIKAPHRHIFPHSVELLFDILAGSKMELFKF